MLDTNKTRNDICYSQNTQKVSGILQDKKGNFWFTTLTQGLYYYDGKSFTNFLSHEAFVCILEDNTGKIWVGSWRQGGVYCYDGQSFKSRKDLSDNMIKCLLQDKNGNVWIGTRNHGVDRYDGKVITNFAEKEGLNNNDVSCLMEDKKGNIWLGSDNAGGYKRGDVYYFDGEHFNNFTAKNTFTINSGIVYSVMTIVEDKNGDVWFGSRNGLLIRYDGKSYTDFTQQLSMQ